MSGTSVVLSEEVSREKMAEGGDIHWVVAGGGRT
jgi:hypothetical protein